MENGEFKFMEDYGFEMAFVRISNFWDEKAFVSLKHTMMTTIQRAACAKVPPFRRTNRVISGPLSRNI